MTESDKAVMQQARDSYEMIDRFLRNNLYDDDYAEYSAALDSVMFIPVAQPVQPTDTPKPVGQLLEAEFGRGQVMWFNKPADGSFLYIVDSAIPQPKAQP